MHVAEKLELLGGSAQFDLSCACGENPKRVRGPSGRWIYPSVLPDGGRVFLLKVLLSNACSRECAYCPQRYGSATSRADFRPEELARLFLELWGRGGVGGLFLSSAIPTDTQSAMDRMIETVEIVREKQGFRGFIHLKILPGAGYDRVVRAAELANRISLNLEAPSARRLKRLCPQKDLEEGILRRMEWISGIIRRGGVRCRGQTTQFVVGAGEETDRELLATTARLYDGLRLSRVYFSAFQPAAGTPLEERRPTPLDREHRLYQADFLFRKYGFRPDELVFEEGNLPLDRDPKLAWAERNPGFFPVEVNRASRDELLRVPGIGPVSAKRILSLRKEHRITDLEELKRTGAVSRRAAPYITLAGRRPGSGG